MARNIIEQLVSANFNGYGHKILKSPGVKDLLDRETIRDIVMMGSDCETIVARWQPDGVVTLSYLRPARDESGRAVMYNHTLVIPTKTAVKLLQINILKPLFVKNMTKIESLAPLEISVQE